MVSSTATASPTTKILAQTAVLTPNSQYVYIASGIRTTVIIQNFKLYNSGRSTRQLSRKNEFSDIFSITILKQQLKTKPTVFAVGLIM